MSHEQIAILAYRLWEERGRPDGSPQLDWERAETMLREGREQQSLEASNSTNEKIPTLEVAAGNDSGAQRVPRRRGRDHVSARGDRSSASRH